MICIPHGLAAGILRVLQGGARLETHRVVAEVGVVYYRCYCDGDWWTTTARALELMHAAGLVEVRRARWHLRERRRAEAAPAPVH